MFKVIKSNWLIMLIVLVVGVYFKDTILSYIAKISPTMAAKLDAPLTAAPPQTPPVTKV